MLYQTRNSVERGVRTLIDGVETNDDWPESRIVVRIEVERHPYRRTLI